MTTLETLATLLEAGVRERLSLREGESAPFWVRITPSPLDTLHILIVSQIFDGASEQRRRALAVELLEGLGQPGLKGLEDERVGLVDLLTPDEATAFGFDPKPPVQTPPFWSDTLFKGKQLCIFDDPPQDDPRRTPLHVAFYSFKGGVGRTTALSHVAMSLARRGRVVAAVDLDLQAPGLSSVFRLSDDGSDGVLAYLHSRLVIPSATKPAVSSIAHPIRLEAVKGQLYLLPAGNLDSTYVHRLNDLDLRSAYRSDVNPLHALKGDIEEQLRPDIVLWDCRAGLTDISSAAVLDLADSVIIFFYPHAQNYAGLRLVLEALFARERIQHRRIDFRVVASPVPPRGESLIRHATEWLQGVLPENGTLVAQDLLIRVDYANEIALSAGPVDLEAKASDPYSQIAEFVDVQELDASGQSLPNALDRRAMLNKLRFSEPYVKAGQDVNPELFHRASYFVDFLSPDTAFVRGQKGSGKSTLYSLFVHYQEDAKRLSGEYLPQSWFAISGHGHKEGFFLTPADFRALNKAWPSSTSFPWEDLWAVYALSQPAVRGLYAGSQLPIAQSINRLAEFAGPGSTTQRLKALLAVLGEPLLSSQWRDLTAEIAERLRSQSRVMWVCFDDLDVGFGFEEEDLQRRRSAVTGLCSFWQEVQGINTGNILLKMFVREDIWRSLPLQNRGQLERSSIKLVWGEGELLKLVLRQTLVKAPELRRFLGQLAPLVQNIDAVESLSEQQLRAALFPLWGERMRNKAFTHSWVLKRLSDSQGNRFPRSLVTLLNRATEYELASNEESDRRLLRSLALEKALPEMSRARVNELKEEYPELKGTLDMLEGKVSPISVQDLQSLWPEDWQERVKRLIEAGVFGVYECDEDERPLRYSVAELYLRGLNMLRKGAL